MNYTHRKNRDHEPLKGVFVKNVLRYSYIYMNKKRNKYESGIFRKMDDLE